MAAPGGIPDPYAMPLPRTRQVEAPGPPGPASASPAPAGPDILKLPQIPPEPPTEDELPVYCGRRLDPTQGVSGWFNLRTWKIRYQQPDGLWVSITPTKFERLGGRGHWKKWRDSIFVLKPDGSERCTIGDLLSAREAEGGPPARPHHARDEETDETPIGGGPSEEDITSQATSAIQRPRTILDASVPGELMMPPSAGRPALRAASIGPPPLGRSSRGMGMGPESAGMGPPPQGAFGLQLPHGMAPASAHYGDPGLFPTSGMVVQFQPLPQPHEHLLAMQHAAVYAQLRAPSRPEYPYAALAPPSASLPPPSTTLSHSAPLGQGGPPQPQLRLRPRPPHGSGGGGGVGTPSSSQHVQQGTPRSGASPTPGSAAPQAVTELRHEEYSAFLNRMASSHKRCRLLETEVEQEKRRRVDAERKMHFEHETRQQEQEALRQLNFRMEQQAQTIQLLRQQLGNESQKVAEERGKVQDLNAQVSHVMSELNNAQRQKAALEQELTALHSQVSTYDRLVPNYQARVSYLERQLAAARLASSSSAAAAGGPRLSLGADPDQPGPSSRPSAAAAAAGDDEPLPAGASSETLDNLRGRVQQLEAENDQLQQELFKFKLDALKLMRSLP